MGRYHIERELGAGGMATVYLAQDLRHHRKVALKVLRPDLAASMGAERFLREIGVAAALQHPHILPLYDSGQSGDTLFYVMPFVEGASLRERLQREGALPVADAVRLLREVADALAEAHRHRVVHRDIKPENIMLSGRHALVADFGVAKAVSEATDAHALTSVGVAIGTPAYMAPEQATADPGTDHRADLYALGVLGYELLAGRPPFQQSTAQGLIAAHVTSTPEALESHRPAVPSALAAVIMRCLEKRAADRYQSAEEVVAALEALPVSGATTPATTAVPAGARPRRPALLAAALLVPALAAVAWFATRGGGELALDDNLVLALPFRVTAAAPEIQNLREGVVDILQASLGGSAGPRVVAAQTAIAAWRRAGGGDGVDITEEEARRIARDLGAGHVLTGTIVQQGAGFVMAGTLIPARGGTGQQGRVEGPADSTLVLVGRLMTQLLSLQAGEEAGRASSLADVPMAALQAYLDGQRAWRAGRWAEALDGFGRGIAVDTTFALAGLYHTLATGWNLGAPASPGPGIVRANLHRLSERDRVLAGVVVNLAGDSTVADRLAQWERAAAILSDRAEAWYLLGDYIYHYGQLVGLSWAEQEERSWAAFNRGLALDPGFGPILTHAIDRHLFFEVDSLGYERARQAYPAVAAEEHVTTLAAVAFHDSAGMRRVIETGDLNTLFGLSPLAVHHGENEVALQMLRARVQRATAADQRTSALSLALDLAWSGGRPARAADLEREFGVRREALDPLEWGWAIPAVLFYEADTALAVEAANRLAPLVASLNGDAPSSEAIQAGWLSGLWVASQGDAASAGRVTGALRRAGARGGTPGLRMAGRIGADLVELLTTTDPAEQRRRALALDNQLRDGPFMAAPLMRSLANLVVARALREAGEFQRALEAAGRWDQFDALLQPRMAEARGTYALLAGDTTRAIREWQLYLRSRNQAEPVARTRDDRIREELARLVGERGG